MAGTTGRRLDREPPDRRSRRSASPSPSSDDSPVLGLQRAAGNGATNAVLRQGDPHTIRRVFDAFGHPVPKTNIGLRDSFTRRHVAEDADEAVDVTHDRYRRGDMPVPMEQGRMANTVATSSTWLDAVDASPSKVETENKKWTRGVSVKVEGWSVRWNPAADDYDVTPVKGLSLTAGGVAEAETRKSRKGGTEVMDGRFLLDHVESEKK